WSAPPSPRGGPCGDDGSGRAGDRAHHAKVANRIGDVMDPEDDGSAGRRGADGREGAREPVVGGRVLRHSRKAPDESLAGSAGRDGKAERAKRGEVAQQDEVVLRRLPEAQ